MAKPPRSGRRVLSGRRQAGQLALAGGAVAAVAAIALGGWIGLRVALRSLRLARRATRFALLVATLRLYRACPDCRKPMRWDAGVCWRCGYRKPGR